MFVKSAVDVVVYCQKMISGRANGGNVGGGGGVAIATAMRHLFVLNEVLLFTNYSFSKSNRLVTTKYYVLLSIAFLSLKLGNRHHDRDKEQCSYTCMYAKAFAQMGSSPHFAPQ